MTRWMRQEWSKSETSGRAMSSAHQADRRFPAHADAGADVGVELLRERVAGVDEDRRAPLRQEVVLVLGAGDRLVLAADHLALRVEIADLLVVEAADRAVAAGEEAQLRRQRIEVVDDHAAEHGAQDHAAVVADLLQPLRFGAHLREAGLGEQRFGGDAQAVQQGVAAEREVQVVGLLARQQPFGVQQAGRVLLVRDLEIAVQVLQARACA